MELKQKLICEFVVEAKEHLSVLEKELLLLEKEMDAPKAKRIDRLFRAFHSIKGAGGFLGLQNIGSLAHAMETILQLIREGEVKAEPCFVDGLLEGTDLLASLCDNVAYSDEVDISGVYNRISELLEKATSAETNTRMANRLCICGPDDNPTGLTIDEYSLNSRPSSHTNLFLMQYDLAKLQEETGLPATFVRKLTSSGRILETKFPAGSEAISEDTSSEPLWYEVLYSTKRSAKKVAEIANLPIEQITKVTAEKIVPEPQAMVTEPAPLIPEPPLLDSVDEEPVGEENLVENTAEKNTAKENSQITSERLPEISDDFHSEETTEKTEAATIPTTPQEEGDIVEEKAITNLAKGGDSVDTVRIHVGILDKLMTLAGELVLVRNQQMLSIDRSDPVARGIAQRLDIVTSELQETIMRTRMQPAGNVFGKLPRIVRDLSKKLDKNINITTSGNEVELDKTILESLTDPLIHIIRNCCDHGIESEDERKAVGKSPSGSISVRAYHEGGQINIEVRDDGQGLDPEAIRRKALESGIKTEAELAGMRTKELYQLIMLPGFTTAKTTTDVSGRGVGMDVVKTAIEQLGGSLELESTKGQGTSISLRLPLTLAIIPCLVVVVGDYRYAIPQVNLEELVCLYDDDVRTKIEYVGNQEVCRLRDSLLPMTRLNEVLAHSEAFEDDTRSKIAESYRMQFEAAEKDSSQTENALTFAVVKIGSQRFGLIVDRVVGTEEIVVKPMHPALTSLPIYSGATVMGDGKVALILDIEGIARHAGLQFNTSQNAVAEAIEAQIAKDTQAILRFSNGADEQFAVPLPLIRRVERIPADRIERIGQKEFVTIDGVSTQILRLDEVLQVSACAEQEEISLLLPKHLERPFGILMSNVADVIEASAELGMSTYHEDGILGTAIVRDRMTLFLDIYRLIERAEPDWFAGRRLTHPTPDRSCRILLAESIPFFQQLLKSYLESEHYDVTIADNGQQALDQLAQREFDLLASNIEMSVMDGYELIRRVRANMQCKEIPAIALTMLGTPEDQAHAFEAGFNEYQVKMNRESLLGAVADVLQGQSHEVTPLEKQSKIDHGAAAEGSPDLCVTLSNM